jgi:hypothetical protein
MVAEGVENEDRMTGESEDGVDEDAGVDDWDVETGTLSKDAQSSASPLSEDTAIEVLATDWMLL